MHSERRDGNDRLKEKGGNRDWKKNNLKKKGGPRGKGGGGVAVSSYTRASQWRKRRAEARTTHAAAGDTLSYTTIPIILWAEKACRKRGGARADTSKLHVHVHEDLRGGISGRRDGCGATWDEVPGHSGVGPCLGTRGVATSVDVRLAGDGAERDERDGRRREGNIVCVCLSSSHLSVSLSLSHSP